MRDIVRRCGFTPNSAETLGPALAALVSEIEADWAVSDAERRTRRREKIAALKAAAAGFRKVVDAFETARPAGAAALRKVLGRDIGLDFSSAAYARLLDLPVSPTLSPREMQSRAATSRAGPYPLLEAHAEFSRQEIASRYGDRLVVAVLKGLAERSEAELEAERANTGGHPAHRARRIALVRLLQLHERLTGRPAPSWPSKAFQDFAARCFEAIGLPTKGLDRAIDRVFELLRKSRKGSA